MHNFTSSIKDVMVREKAGLTVQVLKIVSWPALHPVI